MGAFELLAVQVREAVVSGELELSTVRTGG